MFIDSSTYINVWKNLGCVLGMMFSGAGSRNFVAGMRAGGIQKANIDTLTVLLLSKGRGIPQLGSGEL